MTGKYPARTLMTEWLPSGNGIPGSLKEGRFRDLPHEEYTIAEALRDADIVPPFWCGIW